jgi:hypothetical protein
MSTHYERGPPERKGRPGRGGSFEKANGDECPKYSESRIGLPVPSRLADLAKRIRVEHEAYVAAVKQSLSRAMAAGEMLIEAKAQLKHGEWRPWLAERCGIPERTASRYMKLARNRTTIEAEIGHVADLTVRAAVALLTPDNPDDEADAAFFTPRLHRQRRMVQPVCMGRSRSRRHGKHRRRPG